MKYAFKNIFEELSAKRIKVFATDVTMILLSKDIKYPNASPKVKLETRKQTICRLAAMKYSYLLLIYFSATKRYSGLNEKSIRPQRFIHNLQIYDDYLITESIKTTNSSWMPVESENTVF